MHEVLTSAHSADALELGPEGRDFFDERPSILEREGQQLTPLHLAQTAPYPQGKDQAIIKAGAHCHIRQLQLHYHLHKL